VNDETYRRWSDGWCPCCAGDIDEWIDGTQPQAIGEGVMLCGRCIANEHHLEPPALVMAILEAIALRDDGPIDRLLART
jgi:hypothetical protein